MRMWYSCYRKRIRKRSLKFISFISVSICALYFLVTQSQDWAAQSLSLAATEDAALPSAATVLPNQSTILYNPINRCYQETESLLAIFIVVSAPQNRDAREVFRTGLKSYLNENNNIAILKNSRAGTDGGPKARLSELLFFIGRPKAAAEEAELMKEAEQNGDIIIDNMEESYQNLTLKSLRILKWAEQNCDTAEFLVKIDDDFHLNLYKFLNTLETLSKNQDGAKATNFIGGDVRTNTEPVRNPNSFFGKFYVPFTAWPFEVFPDFVSGSFYVLGKEARKKIYKQALLMPPFPLEDVFISGIVGKYTLNLNLTNLEITANYWNPIIKDLVTSSCDIQNNYIGVHFHTKWYNGLNCWKSFNDRAFVCSHWPLITHCWFG